VHRFPALSLQIRRLLALDESFQAMCDDLAVAEQALALTERLPEPVRAARRAEYEDLVDSLVREIEGTLRRKNVATG
jgi:hypothetical protein